jgi:hypothetical protein
LRLFYIIIPKGCNLIAVGERCATPTVLREKNGSDPERVKLRALVRPFQGRANCRFNSVGVAALTHGY